MIRSVCGSEWNLWKSLKREQNIALINLGSSVVFSLILRGWWYQNWLFIPFITTGVMRPWCELKHTKHMQEDTHTRITISKSGHTIVNAMRSAIL